MTNTNCLQGFRCPECDESDAFRIEARITVFVTDDGTEDECGQYVWDGDSPCQCGDCGHNGTIKDFRVENQKPTGLPDSIEISWCVDDVKEIRPDLTDDQCREVLQQAKDRHDSGIGITWDVLEIHADDLFPHEN